MMLGLKFHRITLTNKNKNSDVMTLLIKKKVKFNSHRKGHNQQSTFKSNCNHN